MYSSALVSTYSAVLSDSHGAASTSVCQTAASKASAIWREIRTKAQIIRAGPCCLQPEDAARHRLADLTCKLCTMPSGISTSNAIASAGAGELPHAAADVWMVLCGPAPRYESYRTIACTLRQANSTKRAASACTPLYTDAVASGLRRILLLGNPIRSRPQDTSK